MNESNQGRLVESFLWHAGPRILRLLSGVIASVAMARHLGPEEFGTLCFAVMLATLAAGLVQFGSLEVVGRISATNPEKMRSLLKSSIQLRLAGALLAGSIILSLPLWFGHRSLYWILALCPITAVPDCVEAVFFGRGEFRPMAPVRAIVSLLGLVLRLFLIFQNQGVEAFAWATVAEGGATAFGFLYLKKNLRGIQGQGAGISAHELFQQSWPLVASGMVVAGMLRLDQILLHALRPGVEVGYYYAVVRFFEMAGILIPSLVAAILPNLARLRKLSEADFSRKMVLIYRRTYQAGLVGGGLTALAAPVLIPLVFGSDYRPAVPVFMAYAFAFPSFIIGSIRSMEFVITEKNQNHLLVCSVLLPLQLGLCLVGIVWLGPTGLALAMAVVAFISTTIFSMILPPLRESGKLQAAALRGLFRLGAP